MIPFLVIASLVTQQPADIADSYRACAEIAADQVRLRCFDAAASADQVRIERRDAARQAALDASATADAVVAPVDDPVSSTVGSTVGSRSVLEARAAEAERRAQDAEAALAAAEARADDAERRAAPLPDNFEARVAALGFGADRTLIVRLEDGQVWRQLRDDPKVQQNRLDRIERATVNRGALGSWRMTLEPLGQTIKVRPRSADPRAAKSQ